MKEAPPLQQPDLVARGLVRNVAVASLLVIAASLGVVVWLMGGVRSGKAPPPVPSSVGTLEQTLILGEGRGQRERRTDQADLGALEWVDRDAGLARIPIERAMDLVVARDGGTP